MHHINLFDCIFLFTLFTWVVHCYMIWPYMHLYIHSYFCVIGIWSLATLVDMWHSKIDVGQVAVHYSPSTTGVTFSPMRSLEVTIFSLVNMVPVYSSWHVTFYNLFGSSSWSIYTLYYRCHFFSDEVTIGNNILSCQYGPWILYLTCDILQLMWVKKLVIIDSLLQVSLILWWGH